MTVQHVEVQDPEDVGQRIDNFLLRRLKGVPRQYVYRILRRGEVRVNGGRIKAGYRMQMQDRVRIPPTRARAALPVEYSADIAQTLQASVIFEDADFLILNKPAGVAVHGGSSIRSGVVEILRDVYANPRLELVHRLDRDTSGVLALAKKRSALQVAQAAFRERRVKKIYELYVHGHWPAAQRVVQLNLERYATSWGERRVRVSRAGAQARTDFEVLERAGDLATRLQATLHTGRTHQIRVHASASGHAILGDDKYAAATSGQPSEPEQAGADSDRPLPVAAAPRLCLHARKLTIPLGADTLKVVAPVAPAMTEFWATCQARS
ncbi:MAG: RluA family pseudouridine synthase [bacterium]